MTLRKPVCGWCRHWLPFSLGLNGEQGIGTCKRYPPTVVEAHQALPQMREQDWCGEHSPEHQE